MLDRKDIDANITDNPGLTPLSRALDCDDQQVLKFVTSHPKTNINKPSDVAAMQTELDLYPIYHVMVKNDKFAFEQLLQRKDLQLNFVDKNKLSPIKLALVSCDKPTQQMLIQSPLWDVNRLVNDEYPLFMAMDSKNIEAVEYMLQRHGINPNICNKKGISLLNFAIEKGNKQIIYSLLSHENIKISSENEQKQSPLHLAIGKGNIEAVKTMLYSNRVNPNVTDENGVTPLIAAIEKGDEDIARVIISHHKTELNDKGTTSTHPFELAISKNMESIALKLLNDCSRLNLKNCNGSILLFGAIERSMADVAGNLLWHNDIKLIGNNSELVCMAIEKNMHEVANILLQRPDLVEKKEDEPLYRALETKDLEKIQKLFNYRIETNVRNSLGQTALHLAVKANSIELFKIVLKKIDKKLNFVDNEGNTALHLAVANRNEEITRLLLEKSRVEKDIPNNNNQTPLQIAQKNKGLTILRLFSLPKPSLSELEGISKEEDLKKNARLP